MMVDRKYVTGYVLAGGKSSRMGTDKASLKFNNMAFLQKSIEALNPLVSEVIVVSDIKAHSNFGVTRIEDLIKGSGPLAGLHAALSHSKTKYNVILSCDIPLITSRIPQLLLDHINDAYDVIQTESKGKTMPITALYQKRCTQKIEDLLMRGERRMTEAVKILNSKTISLHTDLSQEVINVNTKDELKEIEHAIAD